MKVHYFVTGILDDGSDFSISCNLESPESLNPDSVITLVFDDLFSKLSIGIRYLEHFTYNLLDSENPF